MINYLEINPSSKDIEELLSLSKCWTDEDITRGYGVNGINDIIDKRIFVAKEDETIIGYIFEKDGISKNYNSIMQDGEKYFGIEEIYVSPSKRDFGIGKGLMDFAKEIAKRDGYKYVFLVTSTKDWNKILDFYINKCDMTFYCASLVEKL